MKVIQRTILYSVTFLAYLAYGPQDVRIVAPLQAKEETTTQDLAEYNTFVKEVADQITQLFANKIKPLSERKKDFRLILENSFNIHAIGKFVLARHWRTANKTQQTEYLDLFEDALVENYSAHFNTYHGEHLEVINARTSGDKGVIVQTRVRRPQGGEPLIVDWKVFKVKGNMKVFDLVVNGASMSISLRTEYGSLLQSNGGTVEGLLGALRKRYK